MAAALLLTSVGLSALDVVAEPAAEGYRPGYWFPLRLAVFTGDKPFRGDLVVRLERAQVHRVPLDLPAHARRGMTIGILPFSPSVRVDLDAGEVHQSLDLRLAADVPLVDPPPDAPPELWEGLQPNRRHPWGLMQGPSQGKPTGSPSICPAFIRALPPVRISPQRRRSLLMALGGVAFLLLVTLVATRGRGARAKGFSWALACAAACCAALWLPREQPAVSAIAFVGQVDEGAWQAQGFGCASRGTEGDVALSLPGVPRPLFEGIVEAQEAAWGCVWREGHVQLVFPDRKAGEGCWFAWQAEAKVGGGVVRGADGAMINETTFALAPAIVCRQGEASLEGNLPREQRFQGETDRLPAPLTPELLRAVEPDWRHEAFLLGGLPIAPVGLEGADLVEGRVYLWVPMGR